MNKEDIESALGQFKIIKSQNLLTSSYLEEVTGWVDDNEKTIQFALRLAHKVMSEPSEGMMDCAEKGFRKPLGMCPACTRTTDMMKFRNGVKAMINAAIEELEPVNKMPKT